MAKTVDSKLAESSERSDMRENGISELYTVMRKVMAELGENKETSIQPTTEIAAFNQN